MVVSIFFWRTILKECKKKESNPPWWRFSNEDIQMAKKKLTQELSDLLKVANEAHGSILVSERRTIRDAITCGKR